MGSFRVDIDSRARREIRLLPGYVRQRVLKVIRGLEIEPRPAASKPLDVTTAGVDLEPGMALHRLRLDAWRIVYLIQEDEKQVTVLAVRKRPPYQYADLIELLAG